MKMNPFKLCMIMIGCFMMGVSTGISIGIIIK